MKIVELRKDREKLVLSETLKVLRKGGVIIFPTDTVYGIGGDALNRNVVRKINSFKKRPKGKLFPLLVSGIKMAERYVKMSAKEKIIVGRFWPGATTFVFRGKNNKSKAIAVRVPDHRWLLRLIEEFDKPLIGTSANLSGMKPARTFHEAKKFFPKADLLINGGECLKRPSVVIDLTLHHARILRT